MTDAARPETTLQIRLIPVTPLQQNCSLIWDTATKHAVFVDPGGDVDTLMGALKHFGLTLKEMWLTHGHLDHAGAAHEIRERTGVPIASIAREIGTATARGLLDPDPAVLRATSLGRRFLNELVALFLRDRPRTKGPA